MVRLLLPPQPGIVLSLYTSVVTMFWLHLNGHVAAMDIYTTILLWTSIFAIVALWWLRVCIYIYTHHHKEPFSNSRLVSIGKFLKFVAFQATTMMLIDAFYTCGTYSCEGVISIFRVISFVH